MLAADGSGLRPGSPELTSACLAIKDAAVVCSKEALAWTMREIGWPQVGNLIGLAAGLALPSVILMMVYRPDPHLLRHEPRRAAAGNVLQNT